MAPTTQRVTLSSRSPSWSDSFLLDQVDPALGIQSIELVVSDTLDSHVSVESLELAASLFVSRDTAKVSLFRPDGTPLLQAWADTYVETALAAADGTVDFAGASGAQASRSAVGEGRVTYVHGSDVSPDAALLIGTGTVKLPVTASARIAAKGPGNMVAVFNSSVAAAVSTVSQTVGSESGGSFGYGGGSTTFLSPVVSFPDDGVVESASQTRVISDQTTGSAVSVTFDGFDPALGTLHEVRVRIAVDAASVVSAENLDPEASAVNVDQWATVSLVQASGAALTGATLALHSNQMLGSFDGTVDYAGASGGSVTHAASAAMVSLSDGMFYDNETRLAFIAAGPVNARFFRSGATAIDGPGNLSIQTALQAGATVTVSYMYAPSPVKPVTDPVFDAASYLAHNPDVAKAGVDPYQHYLQFGWHEGRNPSAWFDSNFYLAQNPDVRAAGLDPLLHFEAFGWKEGRAPSLLFDDAKYLAANPDVAAAKIDPLAHYLGNGQAEGRATFLTGGSAAADPLVNAAYYDRQLGATLVPEGVAGAQQAAYSYDSTGWQKGLNPDALFDTAFYLSHNPDVAAAHVDPLLHFETFGWREGRDPSAAFSTGKYLAAYADVKVAGMDPLLHYLVSGQSEGRSVFAS